MKRNYGNGNGQRRKNSQRRPRRGDPSRKICKFLRHNKSGAQQLNMNSEGYVRVDLLLSALKLNSSLDIKGIVDSCPKQRFGLKRGSDGSLYIRCNQGHTISGVEPTKLLINIPSSITHGTKGGCIESILAQGLCRMSRNHIHFFPGTPNDAKIVQSGTRGNSTHAVIIANEQILQAIGDGIEFRISENGVILTEGMNGYLPSKYFTKVVEFSFKDMVEGKTLFSHPSIVERVSQNRTTVDDEKTDVVSQQASEPPKPMFDFRDLVQWMRHCQKGKSPFIADIASRYHQCMAKQVLDAIYRDNGEHLVTNGTCVREARRFDYGTWKTKYQFLERYGKYNGRQRWRNAR